MIALGILQCLAGLVNVIGGDLPIGMICGLCAAWCFASSKKEVTDGE